MVAAEELLSAFTQNQSNPITPVKCQHPVAILEINKLISTGPVWFVVCLCSNGTFFKKAKIK